VPEDQTIKQRKILFANSEHVATVIQILKECAYGGPLVGATEFETVRNAVTMDANGQMVLDFINAVANIKAGKLLTTESK